MSETGFYGSNDPTNSVKESTEGTHKTKLNQTKQKNKTPQSILTKEYR